MRVHQNRRRFNKRFNKTASPISSYSEIN